MPKGKKKKEGISNKELTLGATGAAAASIPTLRNEWYKGQHTKIDPKNNTLMIMTEGGPNSFGGKGHETAAKALKQRHEKKYGKGTASIMYQNDYMSGKGQSKYTGKLYDLATNADNSKLKRFAGMLGFRGAYPAIRLPNRQKVTDKVREINPGRVIATHPEAVNTLKHTGIKPEMLITDYGVGNKGNKDFWNTSQG